MRNVARHRYRPAALWAALCCLVFAPCCAHTPPAPDVLSAAGVDYPAWVLAGSGVQLQGQERSFCGVGQIEGMRNVALARATADNRARAELATILTAYFGALLARQEGDATKARHEPSHEHTMKSLLAAALPNVQIVDHWFHPDRGAIFGLARVELEDLSEAIGRLHDLPEPLIAGLLRDLEPVHAAMQQARAAHQADTRSGP